MVDDLGEDLKEAENPKKKKSKNGKVLVEEYIEGLEARLKEREEKVEELERKFEETRKTAANLELKISMFQQNASNSKIITEKKQKLFDEYAVFTTVLMIILTWIAIPVLCVVVFKFSYLIAFIIGAISFIVMICISQYFVHEIRKL
ncbi:MAG: hypothetical protein GY859_39075 [Desulfobacterales bacterium]|nr:hypothetical protein [Desulfobacterales bacterium]